MTLVFNFSSSGSEYDTFQNKWGGFVTLISGTCVRVGLWVEHVIRLSPGLGLVVGERSYYMISGVRSNQMPLTYI